MYGTFKRHAVIGIDRIYLRTAISFQFQMWDMYLTNYSLAVSHLGSAVDITIKLLLYYYSILL